jgi:microcin C transport system substrate-binding protein
LAATGLPSEAELKVLEQFKGKIPDEVFTQEYKAPATDGSGNNRANIRTAKNILAAAGWEVKNSILTNKDTGEEFRFEILIASDNMERLIQPFIQNLKRLGIEVSLRLVDTLQYVNRVQSYEFDMVVTGFPQSLSPGNEQRDMWHSSQANMKGSRNYIGVSDPVIDEVIELIISSNTREELVTNTRVLDRLLLWGYYLIPHYYIAAERVVYWNKFSQPDITAKYRPDIMTWWYDVEKAKRVQSEKTKLH